VAPPPEDPKPEQAAKRGKKKRAKKAPKHSPKDAEARNRTASHLPELLATARGHRAGKDFYAFLDLRNDASGADIDEAYTRYTKLWLSAAETEGLPAAGQEDAQALLGAAKKAHDTLSKKKSRKDYDAKLASGLTSALIAIEDGEAKPNSVALPTDDLGHQLGSARQLIEKGELEVAVTVLSQLRVTHPSNPDVLAELGWATWSYQGEDDESGEEFLQLALTFSPEHVPALEKLGRIAQARGDGAQLADLVGQVQKLDRDNVWAREAAANAAGSGKGAKKRGFWRRGG
jgi:hypothetical protein